MASELLRYLSVTVILFSISTITNGVLQGIGKVQKPVINASISLVLQSAVLAVLLIFTDANLYALVAASVVYSGTMVYLNSRCVKKLLGYRQEIKNTFIMPIFASVVMGGVAWMTYHGVYSLIKSNAVSLMAAIIVAVCVYFVVLIKSGGVGERELRSIPKGGLIVKVAKKIKLM